MNPEGVGDVLRSMIERQPWYRRNANTVTAAVTGLVTLVWWLASSGIELPEGAQTVVGVLLFLASVLGIKRTRNGITSSTVEQITNEVETVYGRHARREP